MPESKHDYYMKDQLLEHSNVEKDLGVMIDSKLTFDQHISSIVKKANSLAGLIRRSFEYMDKKMFRQLFTTIVRPHLEYAAAVWNPHLRRHIIAIENVQKRASKLVPGLRDLPYKEPLKVQNLATRVYRRYRGDMIEMYKLTHDMYDEDVVAGFLDLQPRISRGHPYNVYRRGLNKNLEVRINFNSFKVRVTEQWNNLPEDVVVASDINIFKNRLDKLWYGSEVYFDHECELKKLTSARSTRHAHLNATLNEINVDLISEA